MAEPTPYPDIPSLIPEGGTAKAIHDSNKIYDDFVDTQLGKKIGKKGEFHTARDQSQWETRDTGTPGHPNLVQIRVPSTKDATGFDMIANGRDQGVQHYGGETMWNELQGLRHELSGTVGGENPLTHEPWAKTFGHPIDASTMTLGEARAMQLMRDRAKGMDEPDPTEMKNLTTYHNAAEALAQLHKDWASFSSPEAASRVYQSLQGMKSGADADLWLKGGTGVERQDRQAMLNTLRDIVGAQRAGYNITQLTTKDEEANTKIGDAFRSAGIFAFKAGQPEIAAGAETVGSVADALESAIHGEFNPASLMKMGPTAEALVNREISNSVHSQTDPGTNVKLPDLFRKYGTQADKTLLGMGIGYGDSIYDKVKDLPLPSKQDEGEEPKPVTGGPVAPPNLPVANTGASPKPTPQSVQLAPHLKVNVPSQADVQARQKTEQNIVPSVVNAAKSLGGKTTVMPAPLPPEAEKINVSPIGQPNAPEPAPSPSPTPARASSNYSPGLRNYITGGGLVKDIFAPPFPHSTPETMPGTVYAQPTPVTPQGGQLKWVTGPNGQPIQVPAYGQGGVVTQPTLALVGEGGPERISPVSAPMGQPQAQPPRDQIPQLSQQHEVDALPTGHPFRWHDGYHYIKV